MRYHGTIPWATTNHVPKPCARPNHLWLNLESRLTHAIPWDNTMGYNKPCARPNHLWLDLKSRLTLTIPPLKFTWSNHQLPSSIYRGILHTPPYHLGLSPNFTGELPGVCMPYQVLQPYAHLHANRSITFLCAFTTTLPLLHLLDLGLGKFLLFTFML